MALQRKQYHQIIIVGGLWEVESILVPEDMMTGQVINYIEKHHRFPYLYEDDSEHESTIFFISQLDPRVLKYNNQFRNFYRNGFQAIEYPETTQIVKTWIVSGL